MVNNWKYSTLRFYILNAIWNYKFWLNAKKIFDTVTFLDNISLSVFGESNLIIVVQKPPLQNPPKLGQIPLLLYKEVGFLFPSSF